MFGKNVRHTRRLQATADGTLKWSYSTGGLVQSSPAVGSDGTVYVGSFDNNLYAINPDGTLKWRMPRKFLSTALML